MQMQGNKQPGRGVPYHVLHNAASAHPRDMCPSCFAFVLFPLTWILCQVRRTCWMLRRGAVPVPATGAAPARVAWRVLACACVEE